MRQVLALCFFCIFAIALGNKVQINDRDGNNNFTKPLSVSCDVCLVAVDLLDDLINVNASIDEIEKAFIKFCSDFKIESPTVCSGLVREFTPEVVPIVTFGELSAREICEATKLCNSSTNKPVKHIESKVFRKIQKLLKPAKDDFFYILQLSDIHYDPFYQPGTAATCDLPLCCREVNGPGTAGKWGEANCDVPLRTFESMLQFIGEMETQPSFVVITGDNTPHDIWNQTQEYILSRLKNVSQILNAAFPSIPLYPALGNHDTYPIDQYSNHGIDMAHHYEFQWLRDALSDYWSRDLDPQAIEELRQGGHYTIEAMPGLRLVALNTQNGDTWNFYLLLNDNQVANETAWLVDTLTAARAAGEKVILYGHIPANFALTFNSWAIDYVDIVNDFQDIIVGQFFGHTHDDSFSVVKDTTENPTSVMYIAPSVTTLADRYPSFRLYQLNASTFEIVDYFQYYGNFTSANENDEMEWKLTYQASVEYGLQDLSATSWNNLIKRFEQDDSLFQNYWENFHALFPFSKCEGTCKSNQICTLSNALPVCASMQ